LAPPLPVTLVFRKGLRGFSHKLSLSLYLCLCVLKQVLNTIVRQCLTASEQCSNNCLSYLFDSRHFHSWSVVFTLITCSSVGYGVWSKVTLTHSTSTFRATVDCCSVDSAPIALRTLCRPRKTPQQSLSIRRSTLGTRFRFVSSALSRRLNVSSHTFTFKIYKIHKIHDPFVAFTRNLRLENQ
jgi:hypothetical protein